MDEEILKSLLVEEFLKELTKLSKEYGIYISGCGCCGSPYLMNAEPEHSDCELYWDKENKEYNNF